jgi:histone H3/H4
MKESSALKPNVPTPLAGDNAIKKAKGKAPPRPSSATMSNRGHDHKKTEKKPKVYDETGMCKTHIKNVFSMFGVNRVQPASHHLIRKITSRFIDNIVKKSVSFARNSNRSTITAQHVSMALGQEARN